MENEYISADVSEKIKKRLKEFGTTAEQMLSELGMGKRTLQNYKASMPKADNLAKIADYLDCSVDYLLGRTDEHSLQPKNINNTGNHISFGADCKNNKVAFGDLQEGKNKTVLSEDEELLQLFHTLPIHIRAEFILSMHNKVQELQSVTE